VCSLSTPLSTPVGGGAELGGWAREEGGGPAVCVSVWMGGGSGRKLYNCTSRFLIMVGFAPQNSICPVDLL
jgi:hypothetical protein